MSSKVKRLLRQIKRMTRQSVSSSFEADGDNVSECSYNDCDGAAGAGAGEDDAIIHQPSPTILKYEKDIPQLEGFGTRFSIRRPPAELIRMDLISAMKYPDTDTIDPDTYYELADVWKPEWERGVQVPVNHPEDQKPISFREKPLEIVISKPKPHKLNEFEVRTHLFPKEEVSVRSRRQIDVDVCEFEMDIVDLKWLEIANDALAQWGLPELDPDQFESIVEQAELQCHAKLKAIIKGIQGIGIEYDENVICDVCQDPDSEEGNEMVFCEKCNICVHQFCYGIQKIPPGDWNCRPCALNIKPQCIFCPKTTGALKSSKKGTKWAHVSCALWIPEITIGEVSKMEPVCRISHVPAQRWSLTCSICKVKKGACIQCAVKTCKTAFHVTCGFENKLEMNTVLDETDPKGDGIKFKAYCIKHTKQRQIVTNKLDSGGQRVNEIGITELQQWSPSKQLTKEEIEDRKKRDLENAEIQCFTYVNVEEISSKLKLHVPLVDMVVSYWKLRRKSEHNKPLFHINDNEVQEVTNEERDLINRMNLFIRVRQDLERARNLCYLLIRRERQKRLVLKGQGNVISTTLKLVDEHRVSSRELEGLRELLLTNNTYLNATATTDTSAATTSSSSDGERTDTCASPAPPRTGDNIFDKMQQKFSAAASSPVKHERPTSPSSSPAPSLRTLRHYTPPNMSSSSSSSSSLHTPSHNSSLPTTSSTSGVTKISSPVIELKPLPSVLNSDSRGIVSNHVHVNATCNGTASEVEGVDEELVARKGRSGRVTSAGSNTTTNTCQKRKRDGSATKSVKRQVTETNHFKSQGNSRSLRPSRGNSQVPDNIFLKLEHIYNNAAAGSEGTRGSHTATNSTPGAVTPPPSPRLTRRSQKTAV